MKNKHSLTISGVELTLTSENNDQYVDALAGELTRRINTIAVSGVGVTKLQAAIVCALDLLDENYRLKMLMDENHITG